MKHRRSLLPVFITVFIDLLSLGMVIPVFALLFLDPIKGILPNDYSFAAKALLLGLLTATYPFVQFFSAPILGGLSDRYGRKRVLILSQLGTAVSYVVFSLGIATGNLWILFLSRALDGFTGGNITVANSAIADMSTEETKTKNFGLVGVAFGLGFILGPVIGGRLSDPATVSWFTYATPFLFAGLLAALNVVLTSIMFKETLHTKIYTPMSLSTGFANIAHALKLKNLRVMFLVIFLLACGFNIFAQFFQVYLIQKFQFNQVQIGNVFAYLGIWIALSQGVFIRPLVRFLSSRIILSISSFMLSLLLLVLLLPDKIALLMYILPLLAIFYGLSQPSSTAIISNLAAEDSQGEILGINQSIHSITQTVPPIVAGFVAAINVELPIIIGGLAAFIAWIAFVYFFKPQVKEKFVEL